MIRRAWGDGGGGEFRGGRAPSAYHYPPGLSRHPLHYQLNASCMHTPSLAFRQPSPKKELRVWYTLFRVCASRCQVPRHSDTWVSSRRPVPGWVGGWRRGWGGVSSVINTSLSSPCHLCTRLPDPHLCVTYVCVNVEFVTLLRPVGVPSAGF